MKSKVRATEKIICETLFILMVFSSTAVWGLPDVQNQWGGRIKAQGNLLFYDEDSFWGLWEDDTGQDLSLDLRLKDTLLWGDFSFETHYDFSFLGGDTYEKGRDLLDMLPLQPPDWIMPGENPDRRRLFDLSSSVHEWDKSVLRHRLDRLSLSLARPWGNLCIGRQAVTWGNGMIFNPMDVFNPFAPTDTQRDYKEGDDLLSLTVHTSRAGDIQLLYVPRRDPSTGDVESDQSSYAAKSHIFVGNWELDVTGAGHYDEILAGAGLSGSLGGAAIRGDLTFESLKHSSRNESGYVSLVVNADYSWVWWDKNCYGLMEYYFNGLGHHDPRHALLDEDVMVKIFRNERFVLGRDYLGGKFQIELHPLVNAMISTITNLSDASTIFQPRVAWNTTQNTTLEAGLTIYQGVKDSEFGGFTLPFTTLTAKNPDTFYMIGSWYF